MLAFKNAFLIDGTGSAPLANATVLVDGKFVVQAGQNLPIPEGAQIIDLQGKPLLPGFSDAHTHMGGSAGPLPGLPDTAKNKGNGGPRRPHRSSRFESYDYSAHREAALQWGVTTLRSAGDFTPEIIDFRNDVNAGKIRSPRMVVAGRYFQAKGGHPLWSVFFGDPYIGENSCVLIDETTDIPAEVNKMADLGVDWIKVTVGDDNKFKYPDTKLPTLTEDQLRQIVETAHSRSLPVMAHIDDVGDLIRAARVGIDSIEHTINVASSPDHEMTDEALSLLTGRDVWVVPTMVVTYLRDGSIPGAPLVWPALQTAVARMIEAGVQLGVGCDSGIPFIPYGECVHIEMELLTKVGYSPLQAVTAATGGNARMMRKADVFGTVAPGKAADLVVLGSNPLDDIKNTRDVRLVLRDGAIVHDRLLSV